MIFINTRPANRAKNLTDFLQSQGIKVLDLPLLELVACELGEQEKFYLTQVNDYHALVFISEMAVSQFFDTIQHQQIHLDPNLTFIAVGQKTADSFKKFWQKTSDISPNLITPAQFNLPENNEGLLQLSVMQSLKTNDKMLILKGKEGRNLLKNTLLSKGVKVHEVGFYQRIFPKKSTQIFQQNVLPNVSTQKFAVLITSLTAWVHWQQLVTTLPNLYVDSFYYIILQDRIANTVENFSKNFSIISDVSPATIAISLKNLT